MKIYDVFLSYRRSDGFNLAYEIYKYLTVKGLRVFLDKEKMEDGHYFTTQIVKYLQQSPNYILVATPDVFEFREGEDWVRTEIELALEAYEKDSKNRTINIIVPKEFDLPLILPEKIKNLANPNRIYLAGESVNDEERSHILNSVTYINRHNMWNAGHRWLENARKKGSRFANLAINEMLIPESKCAKDKKNVDFPIYTIENDEKAKPLLESIKETDGHLYLVGEGGIGKTTSLIKIMEAAYENQVYSSSKQITLFIELACAPDIYGKYYENGKSTFIRRSIYQQIHNNIKIRQISQYAIDQIDDAFTMDPETSVYPINDLFTEETGAPEFLLLLDGLNEISRIEIQETGQTVAQMIFQEIRWLLQECPNIRVIMTSRVEERFPMDMPVEYLHLQGVKNYVIREYLQIKDFERERIDEIFSNRALVETLRIPLFLVLFAETTTNLEVSTQGEILHLYFNEKSEYIDAYTMQKHFVVIEESVKKHSDEVVALRVDAMIQSFILDFLIPELACFMVQEAKMYVDYEDIGIFLIEVLEKKDEASIFGRYGKRLFKKYQNKSNLKQNTRYYANELLSMAHHDTDEIAEIVLNCCVFSMAIMQEKNGLFGFIHHYIRDYFAAVKVINDLRMATYLADNDIGNTEMCNLSLKCNIVNDGVLFFVGEILGEHYNKPIYLEGWKYGVPLQLCERNLIERNLDIYRGQFDGCSYIIRNLVRVLELVREDLAGINLSDLDLTDCDLSYINLGHKGISSDLSGTKVKGATILSYGHEGLPCDICYSPDGSYILTLNNDGTIKFWNVKTLKCDRMLIFEESANNFMFSPDGNMLIIDVKGKLLLWDWKNKTEINSFSSRHKSGTIILNFSYSKDGRLFSTVSDDGEVKIWDTVTYSKVFKEEIDYFTIVTHSVHYEELNTIKHSKMPSIFCKSAAVLSPNGKQIAVSADNVIVLWNLETGEYYDIKPIHNGELGAVVYHPSGKYIAFGIGERIEIWDVTAKAYKGDLENHKNTIRYMEFSKSGKYLVSVSDDKTVKLWDFKKLNCNYSWNYNRRYGIKAIFSPNEDKIVVLWEIDPCFTIYNVSSGMYVGEIYGRRNWSKYARYIGDGSKIVTGTHDGFIKIWDKERKTCLRTYPHMWPQDSFACSDDGRYLFGINKIYGNAQKDLSSIKMWDDEKQVLVKEIVVGEASINDISYNSTKSCLAIANNYGYQIWDMKSFRKIYEDYNPDIFFGGNVISFSNDGKYFATLKHNRNTLRIIDVENYEEIWCIQEDGGKDICYVTFSKSGKYIATTSLDKLVRIYNVDTKKCENILEGHDSSVNSVDFSSDDEYVVTASADCTARIWDVKSGDCIGILQKSKQNDKCSYIKKENFVYDAKQDRVVRYFGEHTNSVCTANFSLDDRYIITASHDGCVRIWDVSTHTVSDILYMLAGRTGVNINGVNMCNLHPESQISDEDRMLLEQYGVVLS